MRAVLGVLLIAASVAHADDRAAAAKAEASTAESLAASQKYVEAAARFRAAYRLESNPAYLCNVGVAYQRAKELPRARLYLAECQRKGQALDAAFLELVGKALADVDAKLRAGEFAPVDIVVKPATGMLAFSTFDADETFIGSQVVWLPFGNHTIEATAEGYQPSKRTLDVSSRAPLQLPFDLDRARPPQEPTAPFLAPPPNAPKMGATPRSKIPAILATAVTLTAGGAAIGTFLRARSLMDEAGATTIDRDEYNARIDRARSWQHASWALAGAASVGAIVSAVLWVRSTGSTRVEVRATGAGGAVSLSGHW